MRPVLLERARSNPTEENFEAFYYVQRVILYKTQRLSIISARTIQKNPFLDKDSRYLGASSASDALATMGAPISLVIRNRANKVQALNEMFSNSCQLANALVSNTKKYLEESPDLKSAMKAIA